MSPLAASPFPASTNCLDPIHVAPLGAFHTGATGRFKCFVLDAKTKRVVRSTPWQNNLILDSGLDRIATEKWRDQMQYAVAGTGNTPTKDLANGTYSQTGTTVSRVTGTRDFISGDVGKLIKWTSGEEAKITAFTNATTVTVGVSQTVAAGSIVCLYRVNQTGLTAEVKRTNTYPQFTDPDDGLRATETIPDAVNATVKFKRHYDFSAEVGADVNYTEIGVSFLGTTGNNLFSRMLLAGAVTVEDGQQLRLKYELTVKIRGALVADQPTVDGGITGWPRPYTVAGIVSTGSNFTVTTTEAHHYVAAGKINLSGIKKPRTTITAATSNPTTLTLTATAHGKAPGDTIVVEGMTPSAYNGEFVVDTTPDANTITIASVLNPGTGTVFGNLRTKEPATWYTSNEWTIASVTSTTIVVTSALNLGTTHANEGTCVNDTKRKVVVTSYSISQLVSETGGTVYGGLGSDTTRMCFGTANAGGTTYNNETGILDGNVISLVIPTTPPVSYPNTFPVNWAGTSQRTYAGVNTTIGATGAGNDANNDKTTTAATYTNGNFYRDYSATWAAGEGNKTNIKYVGIGIALNNRNIMAHVQFEQPQRKDNTHKLTVTVRRSWGRDLTIEAS